MKFTSVVAVALSAATGLCTDGFDRSVFENTQVQQVIDLTTSYIKRSVLVETKNVANEPATQYFLGVDDALIDNVAIIEARLGSSDKASPVRLTKDKRYYNITLDPAVKPGEEVKIRIAQAVTNILTPMPETGTQEDEQFLVWSGNKVFFSPYETKQQNCRVKVLTTAEDLSVNADGQLEDTSLLAFGPYKDVSALTVEKATVRYPNPKPLIKTTKLKRSAWISHWGASVSFEEYYELHNIGTKLDGEFSRASLMRPPTKYNLNVAAMKMLPIRLVGNARDVYYTDLVGNVSTSNLRVTPEESLLEVRPRFPLFGGWNYNFTIGWSADIGKYVKSVGKNEYLVKIPVVEGPQDMAYDEVDLDIVLPEGVENISVMSYQGSGLKIDATNSFFDTVGRPTVRLHYTNMVDGHKRGDIYIRYQNSFLAHYSKPLFIAVKFAFVFLIALVLQNISISLKGEKPVEKEEKKPEKTDS